jgi:LysR family nitrogen assimilation transcriptional regulator
VEATQEDEKIELRQLRYFVRIVDMGSLSRAAGVLHVAQSALSHQVAALEDEFKSLLLNRSSRGVSPTECGLHLYRYAQAILKHADDAHDAVTSCSTEPTGHVGIGMPLCMVAALGLPIFNEVRTRYPAIRLQVYEELSGTVLEWVKSGRLMLGIAFDDGNLEGLDMVRVMEERLFLVVNPKSRLARRKVITLRELQGIELVLPGLEQGVRHRVERVMMREGLSPPTVIAEMNSLTLLKQAVTTNLAATILSWPSIELEVLQKKLAVIEITRPSITRTVSVCATTVVKQTRAAECVLAAATTAIRHAVRNASWRGVRLLSAGG